MRLLRSIATLLRRKHDRRARQPQFLSGPPSGDPRLPTTTVDPNARFLGDQMGGGAAG